MLIVCFLSLGSTVDIVADHGRLTRRTINVPFPTHRLANTALRALSVDPELSPLVQRSFSLATPSSSKRNGNVDGSVSAFTQADELNDRKTVLVTHYVATTNRMLRVAVNGFFESVGVVIAVMRELDVDVVGEEWIGDGVAEVDELRRVQGLEETGTMG